MPRQVRAAERRSDSPAVGNLSAGAYSVSMGSDSRDIAALEERLRASRPLPDGRFVEELEERLLPRRPARAALPLRGRDAPGQALPLTASASRSPRRRRSALDAIWCTFAGVSPMTAATSIADISAP